MGNHRRDHRRESPYPPYLLPAREPWVCFETASAAALGEADRLPGLAVNQSGFADDWGGLLFPGNPFLGSSHSPAEKSYWRNPAGHQEEARTADCYSSDQNSHHNWWSPNRKATMARGLLLPKATVRGQCQTLYSTALRVFAPGSDAAGPSAVRHRQFAHRQSCPGKKGEPPLTRGNTP